MNGVESIRSNRHGITSRGSRLGRAAIRGFWALLLVASSYSMASGQSLSGVIDFESVPAGTILSTVNGNGSGTPIGPIGVNGLLPSDTSSNRAVVFDSANPTGDDFDLGTPNETFGGPGIGVAGEAGQPWENDLPLGNMLIVAENLVDSDMNGLIDDPDDADEQNMLLEFDFTTINQPFTPQDVTLYAITVVDGEGAEAPGLALLYDSSNNLLAAVSLLATGCNGVRSHELGTGGFGIGGVARMEVTLHGSSSIDDIVFEISAPTPPPTCSISTSSPATVEVGQTLTFDVTAEASFPGGTVVLDVNGLPTGATMTPALPIDSAPADNVASTFSWTPTLADLGLTSVMFTVDDSEGGLSSCVIDITVICEAEILAQPSSDTVCEGESAQFFVTATGTDPISYQWRFNGTPIPGATDSVFDIASANLLAAGDYDVVVTNPCGDLISDPATLTVLEAPSVTDPTGVTICSGESLSLSVVGSGSAPLTYQWRLNGVDILGANTADYSVAIATAADAGTYDVLVSNSCGDATSAGALVMVREAPMITVDPSGSTVCEGEMASFTVVATGSDPLVYQWFLNGARIPGASAASYTIGAAAVGNGGVYTVSVTNDCGDVTSGGATLTVLTGPAIDVQPQGDTVCSGEMFALSVSASGSGTLSYQWFLNGSAIGGATSATYSVGAASAGDAGSYTVEVTNSCGSATSMAALVVVRDAPVITASPVGATLCDGESASFSVTATGSDPLTYQWFLNGVAIPSATSATYSIASVAAGNGGTYTVTVSNDCGDATSAGATLTVLDGPAIDVQPQGATLCVGEMLALSVSASGSGPLSYQWFLNGTLIGGATSATYTVAAAAASDAGSYTVEVSNTCGDATSMAALVVVREAPAIAASPMGTTACEGDSASFSVTATGSDPLTYQWFLNGVAIPGARSATYSIGAVAAGNGGVYTVTVSNDCGDATSSGATLTVSDAPAIDVQPMGASLCDGDMLSLSVSASGTAPLSYQWFLNGAAIPGATSAAYSVGSVETADAGMYVVTVTNDCDSVSSPAVAVTVASGPAIVAQPSSTDGCDGDQVTLTVMATGDPVLMYQWRLNGAPIGGATGTSYMFSLSGATAGTYDVIVTNDCGSITSEGAIISTADAPGVVSVDTDVDIADGACEGDPLTFTVTTTGTPPLTYQWFRDGVAIPGATGDSFSIASLAESDSGSYTVQVSNDCGSDTSDAVVLVVSVGPEINGQPVGGELCPGDDLTLSVSASGTPILSYQWRRNGVPIGGATSADLAVADFGAADAGDYDVVISNDCGEVTSDVATLGLGDDCGGPMFIRGDCNTDGIVNVADAIKIMRFLFQGFPGSTCEDTCDFNDDGVVDVGDVVFLLNYIFLEGAEPFAPFPNCGEDPTDDPVGCNFYVCPAI